MFSKSNPQQQDPTVEPKKEEAKMSSIPATPAKSSTFSVIGDGVTITGDIDANVDLHIDGKVDGDVRCQTLVQGGNSEINGAISSDQARISGAIEGSISSTELIIESGAKVTGDIVYEKLSIEPGGQVEGSFRYKTAGTLKKETPKAAEPKKDTPALNLDKKDETKVTTPKADATPAN